MRIKQSVIYIVGFISIGFIGGVVMSNWVYFEVDNKLNLFDLLDVIITSILGIYIAKTIQEQHSNSRNEKDFFISETKELKSYIDRLHQFAKSNSFPFEEVKSLFKDINQTSRLVNDLLSESKNCNGVSFDVFLTGMREIRNYITSKSPNEINIIALSKTEIMWVERNLFKMKKDLYKVLLTINVK
jgi:hypothetical protein